ncbi:hypothetical protein HMPREF9946_03979 [Acetobacteraceae bacterium AT-5844]|nr:hypothetical protein HMPREF9946_03979 [Acetobacteraceae bacterium AT-5844]
MHHARRGGRVSGWRGILRQGDRCRNGNNCRCDGNERACTP